MNDLISVIVPIYNTDKYLSKCLESICGQSYFNLEIILVNDGSTDKSGEICQEYALRNERFLYIEKEKNEGLSLARNEGLDVATGKYVSFIDSDDFIHPNFIEILYDACLTNLVELSTCGMVMVNEKEKQELFTLDSVHKWSSEEAIGRLLIWDKLDGSVCDKLFKRDLFENLRFVPGRISEDLPVTINILCKVSHIVHVGEPLYFYFQRTTSITNQSFSIKKMSILESASEVKEMAIKHFPKLKGEANFYYYTHLMYLLSLLSGSIDKNTFNQQYNSLKKKLRRSIFPILTNKYFNLKKKIKALLLCMGLFNFTIKIYKIGT